MPRKRLSKELWYPLREKIWVRDGKICVRCKEQVSLEECHCDHIQSGKFGSNAESNLRTLCRRCHVLRYDFRHRGMIAGALKDGVIDWNWRSQVWED